MKRKEVNAMRERLIKGLSSSAARFKILPRGIIQSKAFMGMNYAGKLTVLFAWNLLAFDYDNNPLNGGIVSLTDAYLEALGLKPDDISEARREIVERGFFSHIKDDFFQLSEEGSEQ